MLFYFIVAPILIIHMKTGNVKGVSITWGLIVSLLFFFGIEAGIFFSMVGGLSGFATAWLFFSFANYLEENIFFRIFLLILCIKVLMWGPTLMVWLVGLLLQYLSL